MGACNAKPTTGKQSNKKVKKPTHAEPPPNTAEVRAVVVYCDYGFEPARSQGWVPRGFPPDEYGNTTLDTAENGQMIIELLEASGCTDYEVLCNTNGQGNPMGVAGATKEEVLMAIQNVGTRCDENDLFFFFYSGHGDRMADETGDEEDGTDEAMCLPDAYGNCSQQTYLRDDDFAAAVAAIPAKQKVIICDCCHSASMCDFDKKDLWADQHAVSICGCKDSQEGAAMGGGTRGGAFTKCLVSAVMSAAGTEVDCADIYNACLQFKDDFVPAGHSQDISIDCTPGIGPWELKWPINVPAGMEMPMEHGC